MKILKVSKKVAFGLIAFLTIFNSGRLCAADVGGGTAEKPDDSWYMDFNMLGLEPSNRFLGSLTATNPAKGPIYIKVSIARLFLADNKRQQLEEDTGALRAFPSEFVLRPGTSFPVRLLVDLNKLKGDSQSYYVKFTDVSELHPEQLNGAGLSTGTLIAYESLVSVSRRPIDKLSVDNFSISRRGDRALVLTNLTGQHIYLNRGDECPNDQTKLVNCRPIEKFPRQSMLPGESVVIPSIVGPSLGFLAYPKLNVRGQPNLMYLDIPKD